VSGKDEEAREPVAPAEVVKLQAVGAR
jgi:hypothetical protein